MARRNARIVVGFERLGDELGEMHPRLLGVPEVRVLARFGSAHAPVAGELRARGLDVSVEGAAAVASFSDEVAHRLARDPRASITREEIVRTLFADVHHTLFPVPDETEAETYARVRQALARVGGEEGFVELLRRTALWARDLGAFAAAVREGIARGGADAEG